MGVFINIDADATRLTPKLVGALVNVCPVDIFDSAAGALIILEERVDECTLCELCLDLAPADALVITKTYKDEQLVSRG